VDATCTPADITFPTDLKLLNTTREKSEEIIDILHQPFRGKQNKPRTYRKIARKDFLAAAKSKRLSKGKRRKASRKQLGYLDRNLYISPETVKTHRKNIRRKLKLQGSGINLQSYLESHNG
jgi:IS5 family transposase